MKERIIRALFDDNTITIYQAFNKPIAQTALENQTFLSPPFKKERMTWIKPSFLWMMYRSGWATKTNQEHILSIKIKKEGFEWALQNSCLSHFDNNIYTSHDEWQKKIHDTSVRIQWDPEKNIYLEPLNYRTIQIGLSGIALEKYLSNWIVEIVDITTFCQNIHQLIKENQINQAKNLLPIEQIYSLPKDIALNINSD